MEHTNLQAWHLGCLQGGSLPRGRRAFLLWKLAKPLQFPLSENSLRQLLPAMVRKLIYTHSISIFKKYHNYGQLLNATFMGNVYGQRLGATFIVTNAQGLPCATIAKELLAEGGSAVDAAVGAGWLEDVVDPEVAAAVGVAAAAAVTDFAVGVDSGSAVDPGGDLVVEQGVGLAVGQGERSAAAETAGVAAAAGED